MQVSLITIPDGGEPVVCSLVLSEGLGVAHRVLIATIKKHIKRIEEFGRVLFEKAPLKTNRGTQQVTCVNLNENQALLVGSFSNNSEQVLDFKVLLIKEFDRARKAIATARQTLHIPSVGLIERINKLEKRIDLFLENFTAQCDALVAQEKAEAAIEARIKREKILTFVATKIRCSITASWTSFWDAFEQSYNLDIRGLKQEKGELTIDTAIRHGYLNQLWEFANIQ